MRPDGRVVLPATPRSGLRPGWRRSVIKAEARDIKRRRLQAQQRRQHDVGALGVATRRSHCGAPDGIGGGSKLTVPDIYPGNGTATHTGPVPENAVRFDSIRPRPRA